MSTREIVIATYDDEAVAKQFVADIYNKFLNKISVDLVNDFDEMNEIFQSLLRATIKEYKIKSKKVFTSMPTKNNIMKIYEKLVAEKTLPTNYIFDTILTTRVVRSSSGVLPISVALDGRNFSCDKDCSYCPNECVANGAEQDMARSYLSTEGTFIRGGIQDFVIHSQVWRRLAELEVMGHLPDKCEFIALGGTFDCYPKEYRQKFSLEIFYACNMYSYISIRFNGPHREVLQAWIDTKPFINNQPISMEIVELLYSIRKLPSITDMSDSDIYELIRLEQLLNTKSKCGRIIGLVLETRPDRISRFSLTDMRKLGSTRVQIGIQHTENSVLEYNNRGHGVEASVRANKFIRDAGFKIDGHIMPDLPGTTLELDYQMARDVFLGTNLQLDYVKVYPCLDLPFTQIRKWKEEGTWQAIAEHNYPEFLSLICYTLSLIPPWTRVNRVQRDFPEATERNGGLGYVSDTIKTNLQQLVTQEMERRGMKCIDIRSREVKNTVIETQLEHAKLYIRVYRANEGTEFFISAEIPKKISTDYTDDANLLGLCRLRIPDFELSDKSRIPHHYLPVYRNRENRIARLRELHVYGNIASSKKEANSQHRGVGKFLVYTAEAIARMFACDTMTIISGVGVRDYYEHLGYTLDNHEDQFMIKDLVKDPLKPLELFGNTYDYLKIQEVLRDSIISRTYMEPYNVLPDAKPTFDSKTTSVWHVYDAIGNGEAEGFSFSGSKQIVEEPLELFMKLCIFIISFFYFRFIFSLFSKVIDMYCYRHSC
jgi:ELP3 family radical SAM enzyme/protein acetyltransferase